MFGVMVSNVKEGFMNNNSSRDMSVLLVSLMLYLLLILFVGPWLWNKVLRRLLPNMGNARWYDILGLSVLIYIILGGDCRK
jgi:hypothetical protein